MEDRDRYFDVLEKVLPRFLTAADLVDLGIYGSHNTFRKDRKKGVGLPYIQLPNNRVRYPRDAVLDYLREHFVVPKEKIHA